MTEITSCPSCQRKLQVPEALLGQDVQCPRCGATFVAQFAAPPPPSKTSGPRPVPADDWDAPRRAEVDRPPDDRYDNYDGDYRRKRRDLSPHRGGVILALGIVGLFIGLAAPIAWIMGNTDMNEIRGHRMDPEGEGLTQAGRILGIIGTIFLGLYVCCCFSIMLGGLGGGGRF